MNACRLKPADLDVDRITEVIYLASVRREPIISVANDLGLSIEVVTAWVNRYEATQ